MKKQFLLFVLILCLSFSVKSQNFKFGIKGGVNLNSIGELYHLGPESGAGSSVLPANDTYYTANDDLGMQFGAFLVVDYNKFYIRPEFNFVTLKNNYGLYKNTSYKESTEFQIPILFGYRILDPISIFAGPSFSFVSDLTMDGVEQPVVYNDSSTNVQVGIMADVGPIAIDVRYQYGFTAVEWQRIDMVREDFGTNVAHLLEYNPSKISINLSINLLDLSKLKGRNKVNKGWRHSKNLCGSL